MSEARSRRARPARPGPGGRVPTRDPAIGRLGFLVVGIGASAGGLDAVRTLLAALPGRTGMAFILVQHLDPHHESMMEDLLAGHTSMAVRLAGDTMTLEPDHLYLIPPGKFLAVENGALRLSRPRQQRGARLPFDFLLHTLARQYGARACCVVLSGTGADGSIGLKAIAEHKGLVIAQDPDEASYDGMPRSAILTNFVDLVLPIADIPAALARYDRDGAAPLADGQAGLRNVTAPAAAEVEPATESEAAPDGPPGLADIVTLLRHRTAHDFTLYKPGTLERRIARRMAASAIAPGQLGAYLALLRNDTGELSLLAKDLLINVTSFFRDPESFDILATTIIPDLIRSDTPNPTLRIWTAGCSTGEETYSLAILFREAIAASGLDTKLQIFASDVDPDAIAIAREGFYPRTIEADVSPARLARFFSRDEQGYRVLPDLRALIVFTVHDVLRDPPFSRLDLVSCRNLLIYLRSKAQAKVLSLLHFALRSGGVLLLGNAETASNTDEWLAVASKAARVYQRIGRSRPGEIGPAPGTTEGTRPQIARGTGDLPSREAALADLCRRTVLESFAPAVVLINVRLECLYHLGPTDRYLHVASGHPTHDLLAMAPQDVRTVLRSAIHRVIDTKASVDIDGGRIGQGAGGATFRISVRPVQYNDEPLLLVCFIDSPESVQGDAALPVPESRARVDELERELEATRTELQGAIRSLELSALEQKAINQEALSINEEFQSTNEELLTSKEELQVLNEELTALNGHLQETLEKQRMTSNDLQNVLYSTDVATLFLDHELQIRFFTPTARRLFAVIPGDVGRPLADLHALASDADLLGDAETVLQTLVPIEREVETGSGAWYFRRILPYRTHERSVAGVVITYADITEPKRIARALDAARRQAERANAAKSRFLAAASHDLRQPLQTLSLIQGLLSKRVEGDLSRKLVAMLEPTVSAMSGMLNALLDINQIEAGAVRAELTRFSLAPLLEKLKDEFSYHVQAKGLALHVVPCSLAVRSDERLLEQMLRNLLGNAVKYTMQGKILLGCRRHGGTLDIEVRDTGIGIPDAALADIFEEYHQLGNAAGERSRGLGLGLSIVQRLAELLGHRVRVRSRSGKGSVFTIEVGLAAPEGEPRSDHGPPAEIGVIANLAGNAHRTGTILVIEEDPELQMLLEQLLTEDGHHVTCVADGTAAVQLVTHGALRPELILADFKLPGEPGGLELTGELREALQRDVPIIILTGDISTDTLRSISEHKCIRLNKPVRPDELIMTIQASLASLRPEMQRQARPTTRPPMTPGLPTVFVVDDDGHIRAAIRRSIEANGWTVFDYATCEAFLEADRSADEGCLLLDAYLPGMQGLELLERLKDEGYRTPVIMMTGRSDVPMAVAAMKAGASDFVEKPIGDAELLASVERAIEQSRDSSRLAAWRQSASDNLATLTARQRQIMDLVLAGQPSKNIAADLRISQRTVENHRAAIMRKTGCGSLPALARLALIAASNKESGERVTGARGGRATSARRR